MSFDVEAFLKAHVVPATGCTEPIAAAFATSLAFYSLNIPSFYTDYYLTGNPCESEIPIPSLKSIQNIEVSVDKNVYKNALSILIPGTSGKRGLNIAIAMGLFQNPLKKLNIFNHITESVIENAEIIINSGKLTVNQISSPSSNPELFIEVKIIYALDGQNHNCLVRIQQEHLNVTLIQLDDQDIFKNHIVKAEILENKGEDDFPETIEEMVSIAESITPPIIEQLYQGVILNKTISEAGLTNAYGLEVGRNLLKIKSLSECDQKDVMWKIKVQTSSASDARMGGCPLAVMTTSGSGNQGLVASMPLIVLAETHEISKEKLCKALLISHLITHFAEKYSGHLSPLCGAAIKAGMAVSAAIVYLMGGNLRQMHHAINLMSASLTGMICDGAKEGCSLKVNQAATVASESALMALNDVTIHEQNGIIFTNAEDTLKAIGHIAYSLNGLDETILDILKKKDHCVC